MLPDQTKTINMRVALRKISQPHLRVLFAKIGQLVVWCEGANLPASYACLLLANIMNGDNKRSEFEI